MRTKVVDHAKIENTIDFVTRGGQGATPYTQEELIELNSRLVKIINHRSKVKRVKAAAAFNPGDYVKFHSRKHNTDIGIHVDKVTPAGTVYGHTRHELKRKVSATLCTKIDGATFATLGG